MMLLAALVLMAGGCLNNGFPKNPDRDLTKWTWRNGSGLTLVFVNYDIVYYSNHFGDTPYVAQPASDFYLYSDDSVGISLDANPAIVIGPKQSRIGTWSLSNYVLTLSFDAQSPAFNPLDSTATISPLSPFTATPAFTKTFSVSYQIDNMGVLDLQLQDAGWDPIFAAQ
jgi:hypothetical protein